MTEPPSHTASEHHARPEPVDDRAESKLQPTQPIAAHEASLLGSEYDVVGEADPAASSTLAAASEETASESAGSTGSYEHILVPAPVSSHSAIVAHPEPTHVSDEEGAVIITAPAHHEHPQVEAVKEPVVDKLEEEQGESAGKEEIPESLPHHTSAEEHVASAEPAGVNAEPEPAEEHESVPVQLAAEEPETEESLPVESSDAPSTQEEPEPTESKAAPPEAEEEVSKPTQSENETEEEKPEQESKEVEKSPLEPEDADIPAPAEVPATEEIIHPEVEEPGIEETHGTALEASTASNIDEAPTTHPVQAEEEPEATQELDPEEPHESEEVPEAPLFPEASERAGHVHLDAEVPSAEEVVAPAVDVHPTQEADETAFAAPSAPPIDEHLVHVETEPEQPTVSSEEVSEEVEEEQQHEDVESELVSAEPISLQEALKANEGAIPQEASTHTVIPLAEDIPEQKAGEEPEVAAAASATFPAPVVDDAHHADDIVEPSTHTALSPQGEEGHGVEGELGQDPIPEHEEPIPSKPVEEPEEMEPEPAKDDEHPPAEEETSTTPTETELKEPESEVPKEETADITPVEHKGESEHEPVLDESLGEKGEPEADATEEKPVDVTASQEADVSEAEPLSQTAEETDKADETDHVDNVASPLEFEPESHQDIPSDPTSLQETIQTGTGGTSEEPSTHTPISASDDEPTHESEVPEEAVVASENLLAPTVHAASAPVDTAEEPSTHVPLKTRDFVEDDLIAPAEPVHVATGDAPTVVPAVGDAPAEIIDNLVPIAATAEDVGDAQIIEHYLPAEEPSTAIEASAGEPIADSPPNSSIVPADMLVSVEEERSIIEPPHIPREEPLTAILASGGEPFAEEEAPDNYVKEEPPVHDPAPSVLASEEAAHRLEEPTPSLEPSEEPMTAELASSGEAVVEEEAPVPVIVEEKSIPAVEEEEPVPVVVAEAQDDAADNYTSPPSEEARDTISAAPAEELLPAVLESVGGPTADESEAAVGGHPEADPGQGAEDPAAVSISTASAVEPTIEDLPVEPTAAIEEHSTEELVEDHKAYPAAFADDIIADSETPIKDEISTVAEAIPVDQAIVLPTVEELEATPVVPADAGHAQVETAGSNEVIPADNLVTDADIQEAEEHAPNDIGNIVTVAIAKDGVGESEEHPTLADALLASAPMDPHPHQPDLITEPTTAAEEHALTLGEPVPEAFAKSIPTEWDDNEGPRTPAILTEPVTTHEEQASVEPPALSAPDVEQHADEPVKDLPVELTEPVTTAEENATIAPIAVVADGDSTVTYSTSLPTLIEQGESVELLVQSEVPETVEFATQEDALTEPITAAEEHPAAPLTDPVESQDSHPAHVHDEVALTEPITAAETFADILDTPIEELPPTDIEHLASSGPEAILDESRLELPPLPAALTEPTSTREEQAIAELPAPSAFSALEEREQPLVPLPAELTEPTTAAEEHADIGSVAENLETLNKLDIATEKVPLLAAAEPLSSSAAEVLENSQSADDSTALTEPTTLAEEHPSAASTEEVPAQSTSAATFADTSAPANREERALTEAITTSEMYTPREETSDLFASAAPALIATSMAFTEPTTVAEESETAATSGVAESAQEELQADSHLGLPTPDSDAQSTISPDTTASLPPSSPRSDLSSAADAPFPTHLNAEDLARFDTSGPVFRAMTSLSEASIRPEAPSSPAPEDSELVANTASIVPSDSSATVIDRSAADPRASTNSLYEYPLSDTVTAAGDVPIIVATTPTPTTEATLYPLPSILTPRPPPNPLVEPEDAEFQAKETAVSSKELSDTAGEPQPLSEELVDRLPQALSALTIPGFLAHQTQTPEEDQQSESAETSVSDASHVPVAPGTPVDSITPVATPTLEERRMTFPISAPSPLGLNVLSSEEAAETVKATEEEYDITETAITPPAEDTPNVIPALLPDVPGEPGELAVRSSTPPLLEEGSVPLAAAVPVIAEDTIPAGPPTSSSSAITITPPANETSTAEAESKANEWFLKEIQWSMTGHPADKRAIRIITQERNGSCSLIALCNALILKGDIEILPPTRSSVSYDYLSSLVATFMLTNRESSNLAAALSALPSTRFGLHVDPVFTHIDGFKARPRSKNDDGTGELALFRLAGIPLLHGWVVDPNTPEYGVMSKLGDYDSAVEVIASADELAGGQLVGEYANVTLEALDNPRWTHEERSKVEEAIAAQKFLDASAGQLTYHGLFSISSALRPNELAVLFRNSHLSVIYKRPAPDGGDDALYTLVTDSSFRNEPAVAWESMRDIDGANDLMDSDFHPSSTLGGDFAGHTSVALRDDRSEHEDDFYDRDLAYAEQIQAEENARINDLPAEPAPAVTRDPASLSVPTRVRQISTTSTMTQHPPGAWLNRSPSMPQHLESHDAAGGEFSPQSESSEFMLRKHDSHYSEGRLKEEKKSKCIIM